MKQVKRVAGEINRDLAGTEPVFLAILNGSFIFASVTVPQITPVCAHRENDRKTPTQKSPNLFNLLPLKLFPIILLLIISSLISTQKYGGGISKMFRSNNNEDNKCYIFKTATFPYRLT